MEVLAGLQAALLERGLHHFVGRPWIGRRLQDHELPGLEVRLDRIHRLDDVGEIGVLGLAQRRGHADVDRVHVLELRQVGRCPEPAGVDAVLDVLRLDVEDVAPTRVDFRHLRLVHVEAGDVEALFRKFHGERQADVAEADHADARFSVSNLFS